MSNNLGKLSITYEYEEFLVDKWEKLSIISFKIIEDFEFRKA